MQCPACSTEVPPESAFCARCGTRVSMAGPGAPVALERPGIVTFLAVLHFIGAPFLLLFAVGALVAAGSMPSGKGIMFVMAVIYGFFGTLSLACGVGLWNLKGWGRTLQIVLASIGLLGIPIGTIISIMILVYFFKPGVKVLFSERAPSQLAPWEIAEVQKLGQSSTALVVVVALVVVLGGVAMIGIIAAIAIPSLLRARVAANESAALGDIRSVISAQAAYASANGGYFDRMECLNTPTQCIPDYPATAPTFLDPMLASASVTRTGYVRTFHPGAAVDPGRAGSGVSPSSVQSFAYVAVPMEPNRTGVRGFCGDDTGRVCATRDGSAPGVREGRCAPDCADLR